MRRAYHLSRLSGEPGAKCGAEGGIVNSLKWYQELDDKHGHKTVIKSAACKACRAELVTLGVFDD